MPIKKVPVLAFLLGLYAIIAQALILRAFQVVFYGNELSYAVLLSAWLFWVGIGSLLSAAVFSKAACSRGFLLASFCAVALGIPSLVFGIRYIKPMLDVTPGQLIGLAPMVGFGIMLTAPIGLFIGVIFVLLCCQVQHEEGEALGSAGRVYFFESLGSAIGGILFSFILLRFFQTTMIAWITAFFILFVLLIFHRKEKGLAGFLAGLLVLVMIFIGVDDLYQLNFLSQQKQWTFGRLIAVEDSPYANIAVVEYKGEVSFFQNGLLSFTSGDQLSAEGNVHLPMLVHPDPKNVLLIGNGLGGELKEILKYPEVRVDFVEIDARLIDLAQQYLPAREADILKHPRLTVYSADARHFVRTAEKNYDVIIINVGDPYTAGINRYYTLEFFAELDRILDLGGIVSFRVSSSENYLNDENRLFLRSLYTTLKSVFPEVRSIPGEMHTFLVSNIADQIRIDANWMIGRMAQSRVKNRFVNEHTLPFLLDQRRIETVEKVLSAQEGLINRDLFPRAYLFSILLWAGHFDTGLKGMFHLLDIPFWVVLIAGMSLISGIGFWKTRRGPQGCVDFAVATTGFSEIIFEIITILAFQSLYGIAYHRIGFILAAFMFGLVAGSWWAVRIVRRKKTDAFAVFRRVQVGVVVYPILLPFLFVVFRDASVAQRWIGIASFIFAVLPFIAGLLGGLQYPLATVLRRQTQKDNIEAGSGGIIYAYDAFGAAAGALVTGVFLIPVYGIVAVCILCAAMNAAVLLFLLKSK